MVEHPRPGKKSLARVVQVPVSASPVGDYFNDALVIGTGAFEAAIETRLAELGSSLTAIDIANRARFAGACIGCHQQSNGQDLGNGVIAPQSAGFTHVVEFADDCPDGEGG